MANTRNADLFRDYSTGVQARVRTGRHGRDAVEWSEPFVAALYLQRDPQGRVSCLALLDRDFAEFDPRHDAESGTVFNTEDYLLEILELPVQF